MKRYAGDRIRAYFLKDWSHGHRLFICQDIPGQRHPSGVGNVVNVANGFTWEEHCEGDAFNPGYDGIAKADDLVQAILDAAWEAGFRPSGFSDIKNETAALREHLSDLRKIAFRQLNITE